MTLDLILQYLLPHRFLSRLIAKIANSRVRVVKNFIITNYCKFYNIDITDALEQNLLNYQTFNAFFTRELRPGIRPIADGEKTIISPVDGKIWQIGKINNNLLVNAKGQGFTLEQLFADSKEAADFHNASFVVLYLAPSDYHRIHMPISGALCSMRYIPGSFFSVNPRVVNHIPNVFAKNERVVITFDTALGMMAMVLVGAAIVGSIETKWSGIVMPNGQRKIMQWDYTNQVIHFNRGSEIASFRLGSTVILLFPEKIMQWDKILHNSVSVKMGQELGK